MTDILSASAGLFQPNTDHLLCRHIIMPMVAGGHSENCGISVSLWLVAFGTVQMTRFAGNTP